MKKKPLRIKDKKIREVLKSSGKRNVRDDFFELLKRAVNP
jgi:hypothetical protein